MAPTILKTKDLNLKNVQFVEIKKNKRGGATSYIRYDNKRINKSHTIYLQTPKMYCPFGASAFKKEDSNEAPRYSLNLSFRDQDTNTNIKDLRSKFENLDDFLLAEVMKNKEWMNVLNLAGKKVTVDSLAFIHSPMIRTGKNSKDGTEYPSNLNVKLPAKFDSNEFITEVFDKNKQKQSVTYENIETIIPPRCEVRALLHVSAVWFVGGKFGITVRASQLVVYPSEALSGYSFLDSDDDADDVDEVTVESKTEEPATENNSSESEASSSEDEEEEEEEETSEPEVPEPLKKPRGRKASK